MAIPQTLSFEELQDILNVSAPTGVSAPSITAAPPAMPLGDVAGSQITYIERPENIQYSMENLPDWMVGFNQVTPTTLAPDQGVFNVAPVLESIQPLMPQQYVDEYADLEKAFQQSIAIDPSMFGGMYRSGIYMPTQTIGDEAPKDEPFDVAGAAAAAQVLSNLFPRIEKPEVELPEIDLGEPEIAVPMPEGPLVDISLPETNINLEGLEESIQQGLLDPAEDIAKIPLKVIEDVVGSFDPNLPEPDVGFLDKILPDISLPELPDISLPELPDSIEQGGKAIGEIVNLVEDPSVKSAKDAIEQINIAGQETGVEGNVVSEPAEKFITTTAAGYAISDAIEDPSASNLAQAYEAIDYITNTFAGVDPLKGSDLAGEFGSVLSGIEALEDGIDSPAEAISVSKAAEAIGALTGSSATFDVASSISSFLAPISAINVADQAIQFAIKEWQGGAAGTYPNSSGSVAFNGNSFVSQNYGGSDGASSVWGQAASQAATYGLNRLKNSFGFEIDPAKAQEVLESGVGNISSNSYYNTKANRSNGPQKVMYELIKSGAIKPTDATPSKFIKSTEAFNNFLKNQFKSMQNYQASKQLDMTGGRVTPRTPPAPFATKSAAENYINRYGQKVEFSQFDRGKFGAIVKSFELGKKVDGNQFLNRVDIEIVGNDPFGYKTVSDENGKMINPRGPRVKVPTHYIYRGGRDTIKFPYGTDYGYFPYDPKYDPSRETHNLYWRYMESKAMYGGWSGLPLIYEKPSKTSALAKDAKLYMSEQEWNSTFR